MSYIRCPYCNQSDGNDDKIVNILNIIDLIRRKLCLIWLY